MSSPSTYVNFSRRVCTLRPRVFTNYFIRMSVDTECVRRYVFQSLRTKPKGRALFFFFSFLRRPSHGGNAEFHKNGEVVFVTPRSGDAVGSGLDENNSSARHFFPRRAIAVRAVIAAPRQLRRERAPAEPNSRRECTPPSASRPTFSRRLRFGVR